MKAFFVADGDHFEATPYTIGPWDQRFQHGGPPCALLTQALEAALPEMALARLTVEFLRPVPVGSLRIEIDPPSKGRTVRRVRARLIGDRAVLEAHATFVRRAELRAPAPSLDPWPAAESVEPFLIPFFPWDMGYHRAVDFRVIDPPWGATPVRVWARSLVALVAGRETSPRAHAVILADAESGMGPPVDPLQFTYLNPDLTVYFGRAPQPGWVGFDILSLAGPEGCGLSTAELRDADGVFGRSAQSLVVTPR